MKIRTGDRRGVYIILREALKLTRVKDEEENSTERAQMDVSYDSLITLIRAGRKRRTRSGCHLRGNAYASVHCLSYDVCFVILSHSVFPRPRNLVLRPLLLWRNLKDIITDNEGYGEKDSS